MDMVRLKEKLKELSVKFGGMLKTLVSRLGKMCASLTAEIVSPVNRFLRRFPGEKRKRVIFAFTGASVLFLVLLISALALYFRGPSEAAAVNSVSGPAIPMEELFIPGEPDFLPEFLPEREPRSSWSLDDIRPYWKNPENPELWRGEIKSAVDKLLEAIP